MRKVIFILALFLSIVGCKKEDGKSASICINGHIQWAGDPAVDGRGWVLVEETEAINPRQFVLKNLPSEFQVNELAVKACMYETEERVSCMCPQNPPVYKYAVTSIRRR